MLGNLRGIAVFSGALVIMGWLAACNNSEFGGNSGRAAGGDPDKDKGKRQSDDDDQDGDKEPRPSGSPSDPGRDDNLGKSDNATGQDVASGGALVSEDEATCLLKKGDDFRILFVFDNSGSTESTDPTNIRGQAALRLVDQFTDFVKSNPKATFKTATLAFNREVSRGSHGWVKLSEATRANIEADIGAATTDPGAGTHFDKAMPVADELFGLDNATTKEKKQRTYMILLSDGQANGANDEVADIVPLVSNMVSNRGVAIYAIQIGVDFLGIGGADQLMRSIALPSTGVVGPDHVGSYVHAPDPSAIDQAFADFFKKVTSC
jgi:Mg-chelatase subunit ChlD